MDRLTIGFDTTANDALAFGRQVVRSEAEALFRVAEMLSGSFSQAVSLIECASGRVAVTGVGKCSAIAQKLAATMNSTGTRAYFLDATAAMHGDLGMVHPDDVAVVLSHSGSSEEIIRLIPAIKRNRNSIIAITSQTDTPLADAAGALLCYGTVQEACPLTLAPSTSTTVMLAIGDALALTIAHRKRFSVEQFAAFHPAGSLGRKLARVEEFMRTGRELRCAASSETVRSVITKSSRRGRRTGAVMLLDQTGRLEGLFTDSDLARLFERGDESFLDRPVAEVMTRDPWTAPAGSRMEDALELLRKNRISELPVVAQDGRPIGILDITDLVGLSQSVDGDWDANSRELQFAA